MKKIVTEFKDFISRGNVMDMAVGVDRRRRLRQVPPPRW